MPTNPQKSWNLGLALLSLNPFIALAMVLFDLPTWAEVLLVVVIVGLVAAGSTLMRRQGDAWLPSQPGTDQPESDEVESDEVGARAGRPGDGAADAGGRRTAGRTE